MAREARLEAERDGADAVAFPEELTSRGSEQGVASIMAGERRLFELRAEPARRADRAAARARAQLEDEIKGLNGQLDAKWRRSSSPSRS